MSSKKKNSTTIFFDASINNGMIGIGIYDYSNKREISKRIAIKKQINLNSFNAEIIAMISSLQYIQEQNISNKIHLFTDNMHLYKTGISPKLLEKYKIPKDQLQIFWVPRELNTKADELSKMNNNVSLKNNNNTSEETYINKKDFINILLKYPYKQRINLLSKISNKEQLKFIQYFFNPNTNKKHLVHINNNKGFLKLCLTIIKHEENPNLHNFIKSKKSLKKFKNSCDVFEYIKTRKSLKV